MPLLLIFTVLLLCRIVEFRCGDILTVPVTQGEGVASVLAMALA